jgi:hypothetical protein
MNHSIKAIDHELDRRRRLGAFAARIAQACREARQAADGPVRYAPNGPASGWLVDYLKKEHIVLGARASGG